MLYAGYRKPGERRNLGGFAEMNMMDQFIVWELRCVRYLCLRNDDSAFVERIKRLP